MSYEHTLAAARRAVADAMLARSAAAAARRRYGGLLADHSTDRPRRCVNCHRSVRPRPVDGGWAQVVHVFPLDSEGRCSDCVWDA